jgi:hypothetical protein
MADETHEKLVDKSAENDDLNATLICQNARLGRKNALRMKKMAHPFTYARKNH